MFRRHGGERSDRQNFILAGWLAWIAGFVNSAGFVLLGTFTSHVTGNVGRLANDVALGKAGSAALALVLVATFFLGAFGASVLLESDVLRSPFAYALALGGEGVLLLGFTAATGVLAVQGPQGLDAEAALLAAAMGIQNSLVTRLSGSIVRTTHLTGVVTDLAIETAGWFRWWRSSAGRRVHLRLSIGKPLLERPKSSKAFVLLSIAGGFGAGAVAGAIGGTALAYRAMLIPSVAVLATAAFAFVSGLQAGDDRRPT